MYSPNKIIRTISLIALTLGCFSFRRKRERFAKKAA